MKVKVGEVRYVTSFWFVLLVFIRPWNRSNQSIKRTWSYQSSISIVLHLPPLILNPSLSSLMTSVLSYPPQQPHPMNLSSPVTLTFISIILQTLSPLSFCLFSSFNLSQHVHFPTHDQNHILDLVVTSSDTLLAPAVSFTHLSFSIWPLSCLHQTVYKPNTTPSNTSLFQAATLHRCWLFSDRPEILSAHNWSSENTWTSPVRLQHHSIFSAWQTSFHRHQTLQAPVSIKPLVFYHPACILIHPPPCWKHPETYSLCCWLVLLQVSPQPIPQAHPVFQKKYYSSFVSSASDNPKHLWQTVNKLLHRKSSSPLLTTSPGTSLADSFASFFTGKYPNSVCLSPATPLHHLRNIVNLSLTTGQFHPTLKESIISPLLKKPTLDKEELSSYQLISNLSLISKIIKRVVNPVSQIISLLTVY